MLPLYLIFLFIGVSKTEVEDGSLKWEQDLSQSMKIGLAEGGYSKAVLECSADWMAFVISTEQDFKGVIYTRGSFHKQNSPCFLNAEGGNDFALKIPYDNCGCKHDAEAGGYIATIVVQHEKDLVTPGDLGFTLLCRDERKVNASLEGMRSRITLVDADPGAKSEDDGQLSAMSPTHIVTLTPPKISLKSQTKQEL